MSIRFNVSTGIFLTAVMYFAYFNDVFASSTMTETKISHKLQSVLANNKTNQPIAVFIYLKDKGKNIKEKLQLASEHINTKALKRRALNKKKEELITVKDLPIEASYVNSIKPLVKKIRHQLKMLNAISANVTLENVNKISSFDFVERIELVNSLKRIKEVNSQTNIPQENIDRKNIDTENKNTLALDYGKSLTQNQLMNVPEVHDMGYTGSGVIIAIFDAGFNRLSHESFAQMNIAGMFDFVNNDGDVADGTDMGDGSHGTNTLSTIGGFSEGNLIGPAYGATYYLAKTENTESELHVEEDNWCAATEWAEANGAQIITSSLGYTDFDEGTNYGVDSLDGETTIITLCADLAAENGVVVINSAGNSGPGVTTIGAPADGNFVIGVGAVDATEALSSFSSVGPTADGRIKPDVVAMGTAVTVASTTSDTGYTQVNGTSFSCPLTAGVAALVLESNPNLTAAQVRDILRNSGDRETTPDNSFGYGLVNALAAVNKAIEATNGIFPPNAAFALLTDGELTVNTTNLSNDSDGSITNYVWDFGDGNTSTEVSPSHKFTSGGTYTMILTVTDNSDLNDSVSRSVTVTAPVVATEPPASSSGGGGIGFCSLLLLFWVRRYRFFS